MQRAFWGLILNNRSNFLGLFILTYIVWSIIICNKYSKWITINKILSPLQNLGANVIRPHGFKVVDNNSDYEEHEISDDEEDLNNNQSLLSNYKARDIDKNSSECSRFFDCLTLRRNYKRNRKKPYSKGQFSSSSSTSIWQKYWFSFAHYKSHFYHQWQRSTIEKKLKRSF